MKPFILPLWLSLTLFLAGTARPDALPPPVIPQCVGVNIHFTGAPARDLDGLQRGGFGWIRMDFFWEGIEKVKGQYDFSAYDKLVAGLAERGIKPLFILDYGNALYQQGAPRSPEARAAFARFAAAAVRHYKGKPILWEIWNEPNGGFWSPRANVLEYRQLAFETAKAIKEADPKATLMAPGTSGIPLDFLESVFQTGILRYLDAVSLHPYRGEAPETATRDYPAVRRLIQQYAPPGKSIPLVSSEWGYSTVNLPEETQAQYLARQWLSNLADGVRLSIWYDWHEDGTDPKENEHHFGTVRFDYTPKPAFLAAQRLTQALNGYRFVKRLSIESKSDYLLLFAHGTSVKLAYWTTAEDHAVSLNGGRQLTLTRSPQYAAAEGNAALRSASSWTIHAAQLFYSAGQIPHLALVYHNADTQAHRVQFAAEGTTLDGTHSLAGPRVESVAPGQTRTAIILVPGPARVLMTVRARLVLDGVEQPYSSDVSFTPTDSLSLSSAPMEANRIQIQVANPAGTAFAGRLSLLSGTHPVSVPVRLFAGQKRAEANLPPLKKASSCVLRDSHGAIVARLSLPRFVPLAVALLSLRGVPDGDPKVPSTFQFAPADGPALRVDYHFAPGWSFLRLVAPQPVPLEGKPVGIGVWVNGDGSGNLVRMRFGDSSGQAFQPGGFPIDWKGWRFITFRLVAPPGEAVDLGFWGGANDGVVHYPVSVDTLLLLDSRAEAGLHAGAIQIKSPVAIYDK